MTVWVVRVKNLSASGTPVYSFQDAWCDLAFPSLTALDVKPQLLGDSSSNNLMMTVDFSLVEASWVVKEVNVQQPVDLEFTWNPKSPCSSTCGAIWLNKL